MKAGIIYAAIFVILLLLLPMTSVFFNKEKNQTIPEHSPILPSTSDIAPVTSSQASSGDNEVSMVYTNPVETSPRESSVISATSTSNGVLSFRVLDQSTGLVHEVSLRDYVRGAVASEMPALFHTEALKAQAVAAHTYALHNHYIQAKNPDPALKGADFAADPSNMKVYITEEKAREFYGPQYADVYWAKICEATDSVLTYIMEYEDEPIVAAYHAISAGKTEAASNVWSGSADYLLPAESAGDYLAPDYESSSEFSLEDTKRILLATYPEMNLSGDPAEWFSDIVRSESGYITEIDVGGVILHGKDVRSLFDLRSHNMDIFYTQRGFIFITYGYGHGVGLSQYGADFLARQGYSFDMILDHYYTGITLKEINA